MSTSSRSSSQSTLGRSKRLATINGFVDVEELTAWTIDVVNELFAQRRNDPNIEFEFKLTVDFKKTRLNATEKNRIMDRGLNSGDRNYKRGHPDGSLHSVGERLRLSSEQTR
ncbi:unnamed protein product [Caenorhabditis auriculariae]|uniref:Uncharacterized protein n=1 Tax=Caenorhabditis auriculariae TaxID=2777116 RepID=A0A8S1H871_9PELO|nr:unnamed protein product [Caenorhabditis auriculariae]